ncbi:phage holin family protein [Lutibacter sp. B2]|nr:phage holin family protein [Lutibacter sp. B2]
MVVLKIVAIFTPFFSTSGFSALFMLALSISIIDYAIEKFTGFDASPFGRGITGFIISALMIYLAGHFIQGVKVNIIGSLLAALAIGIINMIIPGRTVL